METKKYEIVKMMHRIFFDLYFCAKNQRVNRAIDTEISSAMSAT
jgi:hypothetical protein